MTMIKTTKSLWQSVGRRAGQLGVAVGAALATTAAMAVNDLPGGPKVNQLDLHTPVTKIAAEQMYLHNFMMILCVVIFLAVFGVMFYSIFKHRKSKGHKASNFHESVKVEIAWTVVPFIIGAPCRERAQLATSRNHARA